MPKKNRVFFVVDILVFLFVCTCIIYCLNRGTPVSRFKWLFILAAVEIMDILIRIVGVKRSGKGR